MVSKFDLVCCFDTESLVANGTGLSVRVDSFIL